MINYVDPDATRTLDLGPCRCPVEPKPHVNDSADVIVRFPYGARARIDEASGMQANLVAILLGVKRWTLVMPDGSARPIDTTQVYLLDEPTVLALCSDEGLGAAMKDEPVPKASGGRSRAGSRAKRSSTPKTPTPPPSTTQ